jgi:hypothetical protein
MNAFFYLFYFLEKMKKSTSPGLIACQSFEKDYRPPFIKKMDSYIQDSQHLLRELDNFTMPPDCILFSCDFESLYTSLDQQKTLRRISE